MSAVPEREVALGIVGCGRAAAMLHVPALARLPGVRIAALADTDAGALARLAEHVRPGRVASSHRDLVEDPELDAIAVLVPVSAHAEVAFAALEAGKHVFIEKPLALTLADCDRLVERAAAARVCAMVGFNSRWHAQVRRARAAISRGELGTIELVTSRLTSYHGAVPGWQNARVTGGGVLVELAIHHVDLLRYLLGAEVVEISAYSRSDQRDDETATLVARMSNGTLASAAFAERTSRTNSIEVFGRSGSMALSLYRFDGPQSASAARVVGDARGRVQAALCFARELPRALFDMRHGGTWPMTYRDEWRHFVDCIRRGTPVESTLDDGARAVAVILAAIESAASGASVKVARN